MNSSPWLAGASAVGRQSGSPCSSACAQCSLYSAPRLVLLPGASCTVLPTAPPTPSAPTLCSPHCAPAWCSPQPILVSQSGMEPGPLAVRMLSPSHWTTRDLPGIPIIESKNVSCSVMSNSLQLHDYTPPGSSVYGLLQAGILEWVAIPFSREPLNPGIEPQSPALQLDYLPSELAGKPIRMINQS